MNTAIKHENKTVERWVNESLKAAMRQLGDGYTLVSPEIIRGLAATHLLGIFASQDEELIIAETRVKKFMQASEALTTHEF